MRRLLWFAAGGFCVVYALVDLVIWVLKARGIAVPAKSYGYGLFALGGFALGALVRRVEKVRKAPYDIRNGWPPIRKPLPLPPKVPTPPTRGDDR